MIALQIILILAIAYTGLSLYMQHRIDNRYKAFRDKMDKVENKE